MTRKAYNRFRICHCSGWHFPHRAGSQADPRGKFPMSGCWRKNKRLRDAQA